MSLRRRLPPLLAVLVAVAGCGGDAGDDSSRARTAATTTTAVAAPAATGPAIEGTGYELRAAQGWEDVKQQLSASSDVVLATQSGSVLNVLREKVPGDQDRSIVLAALTRSVLDGADAKQRSRSVPVVVDGAEGVSFLVTLTTDRGPADGRVVIVVHDGYAYAIAGSTSPDEPVPATRAFASMLSSWHWT